LEIIKLLPAEQRTEGSKLSELNRFSCKV
jgi:hypothetical protein